MNLQGYNKLKQIFNDKYNQEIKEEIMENKNLLEKILNDFATITKKINESAESNCENFSILNENKNLDIKSEKEIEETLKYLEKQKEEALINLDILKFNEINKQIKDLQIK